MKYKIILIGLMAIVLQLVSTSAMAEVLELGASELHGKKDQPEAMTFISRAQIDDSSLVPAWHGREMIQNEIEKDVFLVPINE